jgi:hypothetical protein
MFQVYSIIHPIFHVFYISQNATSSLFFAALHPPKSIRADSVRPPCGKPMQRTGSEADPGWIRDGSMQISMDCDGNKMLGFHAGIFHEGFYSPRMVMVTLGYII